ncbi:MAG: hypothetical protein ACJ74Y_18500 [Bryobacteraceae bacterium]
MPRSSHIVALGSKQVSLRRRDFLRSACGVAAAVTGPRQLLGAIPAGRKVVIVTFGGGARDDETFALEGQRNIPHLINELVPQGTFFTQVVNRGILGHYVATASIATGRYETFNNFVAQPPPAPTVFEYFRKQTRRPASDAWVIAPSNGFRLMGSSANRDYGSRYGAGVILPKHLLASSGKSTDFEHLLQDSYEMGGAVAAASIDRDLSMEQLSNTLKLSVDEFRQNAAALASPDELSFYVAEQLMRVLAPSLLFITLHDMDVAHTGAFSLYLTGIQRSDRICAQLWQSIQSNPEYKDRTTLLIMPDFGRDADGDPGGNGFQHHRTGSPIARTTWLLALGPGIRQNTTVDRLVESIDLVPTVGSLMGFDTPRVQGYPISEIT